MKVLVEVSWGIGNMVQGTPLCHALDLLGHDVDLLINSELAGVVSPLFEGWNCIGRVYHPGSDIDFDAYDIGVSCFGKREIAKRLAPGFCYDFGFGNLRGRNETELNLLPARLMGYKGPTPPSHVQSSAREFCLEPHTVVLHAGCDPSNAAKRWPRWAEVCERLKKRGNPVVIVGSDSDRSVENWERAYRNEFNLPLKDLVALLDQAAAYMGNDSGVGHIAAAVGLPGVLLFGPSDPVKNAPNSKVLRQLVAPAEEGEVRQWTKGKWVPIDRIKVDDVWSAVEDVLADPQRDPDRDLIQRAPASVKAVVSIAPAWPKHETIDGLNNWLLELCCWNAAQLNTGIDRERIIRKGKRKAARAHLRLCKLWSHIQDNAAQTEARFHAGAAILAGAWINGTLLYLRIRQRHERWALACAARAALNYLLSLHPMGKSRIRGWLRSAALPLPPRG